MASIATLNNQRVLYICLVGGLEPWNLMTFYSVGNVVPMGF